MPAIATADGLEEPYHIGDDRTFSPPGLGVRNSFVGPTVITRFVGDNNSQYSPITDASPIGLTSPPELGAKRLGFVGVDQICICCFPHLYV